MNIVKKRLITLKISTEELRVLDENIPDGHSRSSFLRGCALEKIEKRLIREEQAAA